MPADTRLWHPFADMHAVRGDEFVIARGEGAYVWDADGSRYLDGTASLWNVNVGHGREEIVDAATAQMRTARELLGVRRVRQHARRSGSPSGCAELAPVDDAADLLRLRRRRRHRHGRQARPPLLRRDRHARAGRTSSAARRAITAPTAWARSIGGIPANRADIGPLDPDASLVPHDSLEALEAEIERVGAGRVAAVFVEPVIGAGGVRQPAPGYIEGVADAVRAHRRALRRATRSSPASAAWAPGSASSAGTWGPT